MIKIIIIN